MGIYSTPQFRLVLSNIQQSQGGGGRGDPISQCRHHSLSFLRISSAFFHVIPGIQHLGLMTAHVQLAVVAVF